MTHVSYGPSAAYLGLTRLAAGFSVYVLSVVTLLTLGPSLVAMIAAIVAVDWFYRPYGSKTERMAGMWLSRVFGFAAGTITLMYVWHRFSDPFPLLTLARNWIG